jgi:hypothetical protein
MKKIITCVGVALLGLGSVATSASANEPKSKFYDFSDQLIDGEVRKPSSLYTNTRQEAKFSRMLELKKELLPNVQASRRQRVFK